MLKHNFTIIVPRIRLSKKKTCYFGSVNQLKMKFSGKRKLRNSCIRPRPQMHRERDRNFRDRERVGSDLGEAGGVRHEVQLEGVRRQLPRRRLSRRSPSQRLDVGPQHRQLFDGSWTGLLYSGLKSFVYWEMRIE